MEETVGLEKYAIAGRKVSKSAVRQADSYQQLSPTEQIRQKPTMWISDVTPVQNNVYCFDGNEIVLRTVPDYIEGVERLFIEILSNAVDNCTYSIHYGRKPDDITIEIGETLITVVNGGCNMPVSQTSDGKWIPDILFGELFSSSHYDQVKSKYKQDMGSGGTYGVGATLVNVFSERFDVVVEDPIEHKRFSRSWSKNIPLGDAKIDSDQNIVETRIRVCYLLDFPFFNLTGYSQDMQHLFAFHAITAGFTAKVPIHLTLGKNPRKTYDVRLIRDYASLFPELMKPGLKTLEYHCTVNTDKSYKSLLENHIEIPKIELLLVDVENSFQLTFVNGIITPQHGVHLDEACRAFFGEIIDELKVSLTNAKKYVSLILSVRVPDPKFRGQCKTCLRAPKPDFSEVPKALLKDLKGWDLIQTFKALNEFDKLRDLKKTDGKKVKRIYDIEQLDDANNAGTTKSKDCVLIVVEGASAAIYPRILRDMLPGGRDKYGIFLLNGKPINALNADETELADNKVYVNLKQALGLQEMTDYSSMEKFKKLRYGHLMLAADEDCDGWHIMGLILCMFYARFKSLIDRNFISFWRTPLLRVMRGQERLCFYTKKQFIKWREERQGGHKGWKVKYYKGLGTSSQVDIKEDYESGHNQILFVIDRDIDDTIRLAFDQSKANARKLWLSTPADDFLDNDDPEQRISRFVHTGIKTYSLDNIIRSIPSIMDGLKESMRKALTSGIDEFGLDGALKTNPADSKVFEIVAGTTKKYAYHHGEIILGNVISNMTRNHLGTNNVPWFHPASGFGTIEDNSKPAARYASLGPAWWWSYVFKKEDMELIEYSFEDDKQVEPKFFLPIIAWCLCNSVEGIGTGYSTSMPGYNIEEVAIAHLCLLEGRPMPKLKPWWRGFTGSVSVVSSAEARKKIAECHEEDVAVDPENLTSSSGEVCVIEGTYSLIGSQLIVTALPLKTLSDFRTVLKRLIDEKIVADYNNRSVGESVRFEIEILADPKTGTLPKFDIVKKFRLRRLIGLSNMVLLDEKGIPRKFKSSSEIIRYFHNVRVGYYEKRRLLIIEALEAEQMKLSQRVKLIRAILAGEILYHNVKKQDIVDQITRKLPDIPPKLFNDLRATHFSQDEITSLLNEEEKNAAQIDFYTKTTKEKLWVSDILEFLKNYRKIYGSTLRFKDSPW